ncbi:MMPL family transporter [Mesobacillus foraminis]|uniref:MMPL family transporter n=1 Tax=Mesobacillus foraminis TaxID=279826 RepID=UPI000EF47BF2|nr:MMPL family transporter [Mesobacillus foraminis]
MNRLGLFVYQYRKAVIILWTLIILGFGFFALKLPTVLSGNGFEFDGEYNQTKTLLEKDFHHPRSSIIVLFEKEEHISEENFHSYIKDSLTSAGKLPGVDGIITPFDQEGMLREKLAYGLLTFNKDSADMGDDVANLRSLLKDSEGIDVSITGEPVIVKDLNQASQEDLAKAEMIGLPIALIVLIFAFGGLAAAGIPLLVGVLSILTTMGIVYFYSYSFDLTIFILNIVPMIGLALSIDFALLLINRFKEEIKEKSTQEAVKVTVTTAGRSVIFSGLCVFIGLMGLLFIKIDIFQNVALGGMTVVLVSALSAITFLPALLSVLGPKIHSLPILKANRNKDGIWSKFAHFVMKRPAAMSLLALVLLITALLPVKDMELTVPGIDALPTSYESRKAYDVYQQEFFAEEEAEENKVVVVIETKKDVLEKSSLEDVESILKEIKNDDQVHSVKSLFSASGIEDTDSLLAALSQQESPLRKATEAYVSGNKMLANVYLKDDLSSGEKQDWVRTWAEEDFPAKVYLGGTAKFEQEIFDEIYEKTPQGLALILISTFMILMIAFRSVLIPVKAILMNVLSLCATFGIVVWIFQESHLISDPVSIALILPVFVFSLVFGLSMDYEVFLISRIHEYYQDTQNNDYATLTGLISTSKIISSAAAIMIVITGAFAFTGVMPVKQLGVGIALAIFIDASIVRMILVPALMKLLGDWNWWFFGLEKKMKAKEKG